jgi:Tol biopolymer transport system component
VKTLVVVLCSTTILVVATPPAWAVPDTERVSVDSSETQAVGHSYGPLAISSDGRFVAFASRASNLVADDTNGACDVFIRDRLDGVTERVSVSSWETQGNRGSCVGIALSADARYVAFGSKASNLIRRDTNGTPDVFVRDRELGRTHRVSVRSDGRQGNGRSTHPALSADGQLVAFESFAPLVPGDSAFVEDVYVRNRGTGKTRRVSVSSRGVPAADTSFDAAISGDGRVVAFVSRAQNLVRPDGNFDGTDVFVHVLATGKTRRVSVDSDEDQLLGCSDGAGSFGPSLDADGSRVLFTYIVDCVNGNVMLRDRTEGTTQQLDRGMGNTTPDRSSFGGGISADGGFVVMSSTSTNLVPGDTNGDPDADPFDPSGQDIFVVDVLTAAITRVSVSDAGAQANGVSAGGVISGDGTFVTFVSTATNLVAGDTNGTTDVFGRGPL